MPRNASVFVVTALINIYSLIGELINVHKLLHKTPLRDLVIWNSIIAAYAQHNLAYQALVYARAMVDHSLRPNLVSVVRVFFACSYSKDLREGKIVDGYLIKNLTDVDVLVLAYTQSVDIYLMLPRYSE